MFLVCVWQPRIPFNEIQLSITNISKFQTNTITLLHQIGEVLTCFESSKILSTPKVRHDPSSSVYGYGDIMYCLHIISTRKRHYCISMILNLRVVLLLLIVFANLSGHFRVPKNDKDQKPYHQNLHHPNPNRRTLKMVSGHVPNSGAPRLVGSSYGRIFFFQGQFTWNILKSIDSPRFVRDVYPEVFQKKRGNPEKVMWKHRLKFESSVFCGESLACKIKTFQLGVQYILGRGNHYIYIIYISRYIYLHL